MAKSGRTLAGQKLWTKAEIEHLRRTYPDYCQSARSFTEPKPQRHQEQGFSIAITRARRIWSDKRCQAFEGTLSPGMANA